jgi:hypothetical protein
VAGNEEDLMFHTTRTKIAAATVAAALGATAAPAAQARIPDLELVRATQQRVPVQVVRVESARSFDWGDAAIGAGVAAGALALAGGGIATARRRRPLSGAAA